MATQTTRAAQVPWGQEAPIIVAPDKPNLYAPKHRIILNP